MSVSSESVQQRLDVFLGRGIVVGPQISKMVHRYPAILFSGDPKAMDQTLELITNFFESKDVRKEKNAGCSKIFFFF